MVLACLVAQAVGGAVAAHRDGGACAGGRERASNVFDEGRLACAADGEVSDRDDGDVECGDVLAGVEVAVAAAELAQIEA
ncbi:MAG: hypothetical protein KF705_14135 [Phycisphaeraceae bacterium]|nr:hypothetical protein [Phycisphaeraceae bacterium]